MQLQRLSYHKQHGWSEPFLATDSANSLVLTFGDAHFRDTPEPLQELYAAYPQAHHLAARRPERSTATPSATRA